MSGTGIALTLDAPALVGFGLVALRVAAMLATAPGLQHPAVPVQVRVALSLALALLAVSGRPPRVSAPTALALMPLALIEVVVGAALGFVARLALSAVSAAAEFVALQMGLGLAATLDTTQDAALTPLGVLMDWVAIALFFTTGADRLLVRATVGGLELLPTGASLNLGALARALPALAQQALLLTLAIAGPALATLFLTNVVLVVGARALPQLHLMTLAWPVTIVAGLLMLVFTLDLAGHLTVAEFDHWRGVFERLLVGLARG